MTQYTSISQTKKVHFHRVAAVKTLGSTTQGLFTQGLDTGTGFIGCGMGSGPLSR